MSYPDGSFMSAPPMLQTHGLPFAWGQAMIRPFSPRQALEAFAAIPRSRLIGTNVHATLVLGKQRLCSKASVFIDASAAQPSPAVRKCANA